MDTKKLFIIVLVCLYVASVSQAYFGIWWVVGTDFFGDPVGDTRFLASAAVTGVIAFGLSSFYVFVYASDDVECSECDDCKYKDAPDNQEPCSSCVVPHSSNFVGCVQRDGVEKNE